MVKGYDATLKDPTKLLLDYLFSSFDKYTVNISPNKAS